MNLGMAASTGHLDSAAQPKSAKCTAAFFCGFQRVAAKPLVMIRSGLISYTTQFLLMIIIHKLQIPVLTNQGFWTLVNWRRHLHQDFQKLFLWTFPFSDSKVVVTILPSRPSGLVIDCTTIHPSRKVGIKPSKSPFIVDFPIKNCDFP